MAYPRIKITSKHSTIFRNGFLYRTHCLYLSNHRKLLSLSHHVVLLNLYQFVNYSFIIRQLSGYLLAIRIWFRKFHTVQKLFRTFVREFLILYCCKIELHIWWCSIIFWVIGKPIVFKDPVLWVQNILHKE